MKTSGRFQVIFAFMVTGQVTAAVVRPASPTHCHKVRALSFSADQ